jgi:hypothetical protein
MFAPKAPGRSPDEEHHPQHRSVRDLILAATLTAPPASAATGSWNVDQLHPTIYSDGDTRELMFWKSMTYPANSQIASTTVVVRPYANGATDVINICYIPHATDQRNACTGNMILGGVTTTYPLSNFNGLSPKGAIAISHTLTGGTYFAYPNGVKDSATVNYAY